MQAAYISPHNYLMSRPVSPDFEVWKPAKNPSVPSRDSAQISHPSRTHSQSQNDWRQSDAGAVLSQQQRDYTRPDATALVKQTLGGNPSFLATSDTPGPHARNRERYKASAENGTSVSGRSTQATSTFNTEAMFQDRRDVATNPVSSHRDQQARPAPTNYIPDGNFTTYTNNEDNQSSIHGHDPGTTSNEAYDPTMRTVCAACHESIVELKLDEFNASAGPSGFRHLLRSCHPNWKCYTISYEQVLKEPSIQTELSRLPGNNPKSYLEEIIPQDSSSQQQGYQGLTGRALWTATQKKKRLVDSLVYCPCETCHAPIFSGKDIKRNGHRSIVSPPTKQRSMCCGEGLCKTEWASGAGEMERAQKWAG